MKPDIFEKFVNVAVKEYRNLHEKELQDSHVNGLTQGWEDCRQAHKVILPRVLEDLIKAAKNHVDTAEAEKALEEYKKNNNVLPVYNDKELLHVMQVSFEEGIRHVIQKDTKELLRYPDAFGFATNYITLIKRSDVFVELYHGKGEDCCDEESALYVSSLLDRSTEELEELFKNPFEEKGRAPRYPGDRGEEYGVERIQG